MSGDFHALTFRHYFLLGVAAVLLVPLLWFNILPSPPVPVLMSIYDQKNTNSPEFVQNWNKKGLSFPVLSQPWTLNPQTLTQTTYGSLSLVEAVSLSADSADFGGISGLSALPGRGQFRAVTDAGMIFTLLDKGQGTKDRFSVTGFRPVFNRGKNKRDNDAESVVVMPFGFDLVTYERAHRIMLGDIRLENPKGLADLPLNGGLEGAALLSDGRLVVAAQKPLPDDLLPSLWRTRTALQEGQVHYDYDRYFYQSQGDGFQVSGLAALNDGGLIILERRFSPIFGFSAALCYLSAAQLSTVKNDGVLKPQLLALLSDSLSMDNFEGLALREDGKKVTLTMISDDNFRRRQKTLLLTFVWQRP